MSRPSRTARSSSLDLEPRLNAFVIERFPYAAARILGALAGKLRIRGASAARRATAIETAWKKSKSDLRDALGVDAPGAALETTPGIDAAKRLEHARDEILDAVDGFMRREAIVASLSEDEQRELLRGMILTRAVDNQLKALFLSGEVRFAGAGFQGKGFRSLGQEAIYAASLRLRRGESFRDDDGSWRGDVIAPLIRDLGAALAMSPDAQTVRMALSAQAGKAGPPMDGRDFHIGDFGRGILPASAPLSISSVTAAGVGLAFRLRDEERVAVSFIGEGGASLGEWHEAINLCSAARLPVVFCLQNNQTALSTPVHEQSAVRTFADKAEGYGIPGISVDGTDPEAIAAAFGWAAERARRGDGPVLIELIAMRMCGHAHHDDMLYLGREPQASWDYPVPGKQGYADAERYAFWARRDPIVNYAALLLSRGVIEDGALQTMKTEAEQLVRREANAVVEAPWPDPADVGKRVLADEPPRRFVEVLENRRPPGGPAAELPALDEGPAFEPGGNTFLEAVMLGIGDALAADERVFVYGEDVGGKYGNAFLLLRPLLEKYGERLVNSPLSEAGVLGVCTGAALAGLRPIAEIQFNDFVATGFNQLVNNAAKTRYRWGAAVPMVVRLPWGGMRRAGPFHSQNTEPWFYRTPGLKIVTPSTPWDARALMASAVADPDPVLYYEHIGLYRDPRVKQRLGEAPPPPLPLGRAALRRAGSDLGLVSYGAYVHVCMRVADALARDGIEASVLDLRSLVPLDRERLLAVARHCGKVLIAHEDSRTGGIGESLAAVIQEEAFEDLDAPVRVVGALDTPVPYAPSLEDEFLPGPQRIERAARLLVAY